MALTCLSSCSWFCLLSCKTPKNDQTEQLKSHLKATLSPNTQSRVYYIGMTSALSLRFSLLHFKLIKAEFSFIILKWMMCEKTLNPSLIVWTGMCVFPCQLLDYQWSRLLHHLRRLLLPGVSAQHGHVCRGDAADLRTQRQTQQPHAAERGLYSFPVIWTKTVSWFKKHFLSVVITLWIKR